MNFTAYDAWIRAHPHQGLSKIECESLYITVLFAQKSGNRRSLPAEILFELVR